MDTEKKGRTLDATRVIIWAEATVEVCHVVSHPITIHGMEGGYPMHGHSYWIKAHVESVIPTFTTKEAPRLDPPSVEKLQKDLKEAVKEVDHNCLNMYVECGTMEGLAKYVFEKLLVMKWNPIKVQIERKSLGVGAEYSR